MNLLTAAELAHEIAGTAGSKPVREAIEIALLLAAKRGGSITSNSVLCELRSMSFSREAQSEAVSLIEADDRELLALYIFEDVDREAAGFSGEMVPMPTDAKIDRDADCILNFDDDSGRCNQAIVTERTLTFLDALVEVPISQIERIVFEKSELDDSGRFCVEVAGGVDLWFGANKAHAVEFARRVGIVLGDEVSPGRCWK